jgi:hypothetical protein
MSRTRSRRKFDLKRERDDALSRHVARGVARRVVA